MTTLIFEDRGHEVVTSSWSVAAKPGKSVQICYAWGADALSWFDSATGLASFDLEMTMEQFISRITKGGPVVDLREKA
jgi:hypothetical protein